MYKLTVKKNVPNPNFNQAELDRYIKSRNDRYMSHEEFNLGELDKEIEATILTVELNEEEFKALKKSVIETIK